MSYVDASDLSKRTIVELRMTSETTRGNPSTWPDGQTPSALTAALFVILRPDAVSPDLVERSLPH